MIQGPNIDIFFHQSELPSLDVQKNNDSFIIIAQYKIKGIKIPLIDIGYALNVCSLSLLDRLDIDQSTIRLDYFSIKGFENVKKKPLGVNIMSLTARVVTLNTPIQVIPYELSCNLILGGQWIHAMNGVPSTLHHKMKYIYNNIVHTLDVDVEPDSVFQLERNKENSLNTST